MNTFKNWLQISEMAIIDFGSKTGKHINDLSIKDQFFNGMKRKSYVAWMLDQINTGEARFRIKADDNSGNLTNDQIKKALEIRLSGKKIAPTSVREPIRELESEDQYVRTKTPTKKRVPNTAPNNAQKPKLEPGAWVLAEIIKDDAEYKLKKGHLVGLKNNNDNTWTYGTFYKGKVENHGTIETSRLKEYFSSIKKDGKLITSNNILKLARSQHQEDKKEITLSDEQKKIDSFFGKMKDSDDPQHMIIEALAGSGKTTMLLNLAKKYTKPGDNWLYLVFNSRNQKEAKEKFPKMVEVLTTHSFAGKLLKANGIKVKPTDRIMQYSKKTTKISELQDGQSYRNHLKSMGIIHHEDSKLFPNFLKPFIRGIWINFNNEVSSLVGKAKAYVVDPSKSNIKEKINEILEDYNFDTDLEKVKENVAKNPSANERLSEIYNLDNFLTHDFKEEIKDAAVWLLEKSIPHGTDDEFLQTHEKSGGTWKELKEPVKRKLGELRDFDDDLWFLALHENDIDWEKYKKYKVVLVDEIQDFNKAQQTIIKNLMKTGAKVVAVGDPNQAMYRFRGADSKSFDDISKMLIDNSKDKEGAKQSLTYNFRSLPELIDHNNKNTKVKSLRSGVEKDPHKEGLVTNKEYKYQDVIDLLSSEKKSLGHVKKETALIARTNAPLIKAAMDLLKNNIPFVIYGKDLSTEILQLIDRIMRWSSYSVGHDSHMESFEKEMNDFTNEKVEKWSGKVKKQGELKDLINNKEAISGAITSALSENPDMDVKAFKSWLIRRLGGVDENLTQSEIKRIKKEMEDTNSVVLVTVHKSKGLEFDRVFELTPSLYPHPKSTLESDVDQEENAFYVSSTRAKEELHYVNDEEEK